jgi:hypothetical protein
MKNVKPFCNFISEDIFMDGPRMPEKVLRYSGGDVTKMPILGEIETDNIAGVGSATYNIVEIIEGGKEGDCIYVADMWYKPGVPQLIHSAMVSRFTPEWEKIK